jgi:hypothetical protein
MRSTSHTTTLPPCAVCRQPATVQHDAHSPQLCASCYIAKAVPLPRISVLRRALPWLLLIVLVAALVAALVWGLPLMALAAGLPPVLAAKCRGCGAEIWPGLGYCAACRKGG